MPSPFPSITIEDLSPCIDGGKVPIKRILGQCFLLESTIFKEGHEVVRALVKWRFKQSQQWQEAPMEALGNHRFQGSFPLSAIGITEYTIEAWGDVFDSWREEMQKKIAASRADLDQEIAEGALLIQAAFKRCQQPQDKKTLQNYAQYLAAISTPGMLKDFLANEEMLCLMRRYPDRSFSTTHEPLQKIRVDRERANFAAWYEFFPRSAEGKKESGSPFRNALARIEDAHAMGFDVIYFPPIHPIGLTGRKGRNNSLTCLAEDPGVPYAIGSFAGGHDAIEPLLGTLADFQWLVAQVKSRGMEVALDFALNCSPDHPYVKKYPHWFFRRPDGSIKYAENPPKKYEDVYPLNFYNPQWKELWEELLRVLCFWAKQGVHIFRVDNPHTKPVAFWEWVIARVQEQFPEVIFLSEAFTHPAMMKKLAKIGFTQSYTYFTWRNTKEELETYFNELSQSAMKDYFRPHLFPNTPDILPFYLQEGGRPAFLIRALLAATLSSVYGIYSGFELCENAAIPGKEEYADSEKYQFKERNWNAPGNIKPWITRLNHIRNTNRALQSRDRLHFCSTSNAAIIAYLRSCEEDDSHLLITVNLDPHHQQSGMVELPLDFLYTAHDRSYVMKDLLTGDSYEWKGSHNFVSLNPLTHPAHVFKVEKTGRDS